MEKLINILKSHGYECDGKDIDSVLFIVDSYDLDNEKMVVKHIDIDFEYGEYLEIHEGEKIYDEIFKLYEIEDGDDEKEQVLYEKRCR